MNKIAIIYGTLTGNTEEAAIEIQEKLGSEFTTIIDVYEATASDLENYDNIIFGASTWGIGDLQEDFTDFLSVIESTNMKNKKVAIFGFGDQDSYPDTFVDGMGVIYECLNKKGCDIIGYVSTEGYQYDESRAVIDGKFIGLPLDYENQDELTSDRISNWIDQIKTEFNQ